jgi:hypothetical protein
MTTGGDTTGTRVHGWFRIAVSGSTQEECLERARQVVDTYRKRQVTIAHPKGQHGLLREFIPGEPLSSTAYRRRLPACTSPPGCRPRRPAWAIGAGRTWGTPARRPGGR